MKINTDIVLRGNLSPFIMTITRQNFVQYFKVQNLNLTYKDFKDELFEFK